MIRGGNMKIAVCSDIHLEFGPITLKNTEGADLLVLSGDILVAADLFPVNDPYGIVQTGKYERFLEFFENVSKEFPKVVYIMGNHEHYHGDFGKSATILRSFLKPFDNVTLLDKEFIEVGDFIVYGGTLWTNFDIGYGAGDHSAMREIQGMMNDYRGVKNSARKVSRKVPVYKKDEAGQYVLDETGRMVQTEMKFIEDDAKFCTQDSFDDHNAFIEGLYGALKSRPEMKFIVCGHHAPSKQSTHPRYKDEVTMNAAYSSNLTHHMLNNPQIKLWTHGHTHEVFDYMVGSTRIVCNPRGYDKYEQRAEDFELKFVEV